MEKNYLVKYGEVDAQGNVYTKGCFGDLKHLQLSQDEKGVYITDQVIFSIEGKVLKRVIENK